MGTRRQALGAAALTVALVLVGCSGSSDDDAGTPSTTGADASTTTSAPQPVDLGEPLADQSPPTGANGITVDEDGRIWIADLSGDQIVAVDPADGAILVRLGTAADVNAPDDLAFDADGRLWWTDNERGNVGRIDDPLAATARSTVVAEIGPGANPIAIASDGTVYVAQTLAGDALWALDPDDPSEPRLVLDAPGNLNAFALGDDGTLYSPRYLDGTGSVVAIDLATGEVRELLTGLSLPVSVKLAPDGTLRALTVVPAEVLTVDPNTGTADLLAELPAPAADNQVIDADGTLWVSAFDKPLLWSIAGEGEAEPVPLPIGDADA